MKRRWPTFTRRKAPHAACFPADHAFWAGLYDQRGWVNIMRKAAPEARADFLKAVSNAAVSPMIAAQSREGLGKAWLDAGEGAKARENLRQSHPGPGIPTSLQTPFPWAGCTIPWE